MLPEAQKSYSSSCYLDTDFDTDWLDETFARRGSLRPSNLNYPKTKLRTFRFFHILSPRIAVKTRPIEDRVLLPTEFTATKL